MNCRLTILLYFTDNPWLSVDLRDKYEIHRISITNREGGHREYHYFFNSKKNIYFPFHIKLL